MYAQYAHAAPSHTPYLDDINFIAALREKETDKEKYKEIEKDKDKDKDKEKDNVKDKEIGRDKNRSGVCRELYDMTAQNDEREVSNFISLFSSHLPLPIFSLPTHYSFSFSFSFFVFAPYLFLFECVCLL